LIGQLGMIVELPRNTSQHLGLAIFTLTETAVISVLGCQQPKPCRMQNPPKYAANWAV